MVQEDNRFYPEWRSFWTFGRWRRFYYTKENDREDYVHLRGYGTEDEAWEFIRGKKKQSKFTQYDTERGEKK